MNAAVLPEGADAMPHPGATAPAPLAPFLQDTVTLTRQEHMQLVMAANYWKAMHQRALSRAQWSELRHQHELEQARQRDAKLRGELELAQAQLRDLRQRVFGARTEQSRFINPVPQGATGAPRPRGQQRGRRGHGRTRLEHLSARTETLKLDAKCPRCGLGLREFPGTEDCEVVELEVKAYRRVIRRQRYRPTCGCGCLAGIVTAPPPARLIPRGKLGVSVWVNALLSKFQYGQPTHRLLHDWRDQGLPISQGTLTDGLRRLAPLFAPLVQAGLTQLRTQSHWHADETRWEVFAEHDGKVGHRWYLWVFQSATVVHYVLDPSRSAQVPGATLEGVDSGILSVDRYSAYKKYASQNPGISLSYCWAHQRRDFLKVANDHPALWDWAMGWAGQIGQLYRLHELRRRAHDGGHGEHGACGDGNDVAGTAAFIEHDRQLRQAVQAMQARCDDALADAQLATPARKVLQSLKVHWSGLVVFVEHPWLDLDNNAAERALRPAVVGRKNYYGSGSQWSGELAAAVMSLLMTARLWQLNVRTWLTAYLQTCADEGGRAPADVSAFVPWQMDARRLAAMRGAVGCHPAAQWIDTS